MISLRDAKVISPEILAATFPFLSITTVDGIALAGSDFLKPINTESSINVGYGSAKRRTKASAVAGLSRVRIPIKATSVYFSDSAASVGASARQGAHHDAHTFTTATWPPLKV